MISPKNFLFVLPFIITGVTAIVKTPKPHARPLLAERQDLTDSSLLNVPKYDYIIIGGGTAGLVMANRLSENASISVAVIEAGGYYEKDNPTFSTVPALGINGAGSDAQDTNPVDWGFVTTPQPGAKNRKIHYARGKCLGGRYV
jgi:GMC oxidoreductase